MLSKALIILLVISLIPLFWGECHRLLEEEPYFILAPKVVRSNSIYKIIVHVRNPLDIGKLLVYGSLTQNGDKITNSVLEERNPSELEELMLRVPGNIRSTNGSRESKLTLRVNLDSSKLGKREYEESLVFSETFLSILIESDRLIYTGGQTVAFRIIMTDLDFKPYQGQGSMILYDPDGFIVRRWISRSLNLGVLSNSFTLPEYPKIGFWRVLVTAEGQESDLTFKVEKYYTPPLEVRISLPAIVDPGGMTELEATVQASFVTERPSKGSMALKWMAKETDDSTPMFREKCVEEAKAQRTSWTSLQESSWTYYGAIANEDIHWRLPLNKIENTFGTLINIQVRVEVSYTDYFYNGTQMAFAETKLVRRKILLEVAHEGLIAGMPFQITFWIKDSITGERLEREELLDGVMSISVLANDTNLLELSLRPQSSLKESIREDFDRLLSREHYQTFVETGSYTVNLPSTPVNITALQVFATFETSEKQVAYNKTILTQEKTKEQEDLSIHVNCLTKKVLVGNYAVFHVKSNFHMEHYHWMIMSKDLILKTGVEGGDFQEDKITSSFSLVVSREMVPTFQLLTYGEVNGSLVSDYVRVAVSPGDQDERSSFYFSQIKDHGMWTVEAGVKGTPGSIFMMTSMRLGNYENGQGRNLITRDRFINNFERIQVYTDPRKSLLLLGSSDPEDSSEPIQVEYPMDDSCNDNYLLSRENRFNDFYDSGDGNWGYKTLNIDQDGELFVTLDIPGSPDEWLFLGTTIDPEGAISFSETIFSTERPIDLYCEAPEWIRRGENFGVRCIVHNRSNRNLEVILKLLGSSDFNFVEVEAFGFVKSFSPRLSSGEKHHLIYVRSEESFEVEFPVAPSIQSGTISVEIQMSTQIMQVNQVVDVGIEPEGSTVLRHTSFLLDLKNRGNVYKFAKIVVDESPIIPYEVYRRYIYGSARGSIVISGDVVGPIFPRDAPVSADNIFPSGRSDRIPTKGAELHLFNLAANAIQLHYIRLSNQIPKLDPSLLSSIFEKMNLELLGALRYFSAHGTVTAHDSSDPSVYLTAWALFVFHHVIFQDWEEFIFIDKKLLASSILWLINYQTYRGDFVAYLTTFPLSPWPNFHLTAFVLIALQKTCHYLSSHERQICFISRSKAVSILEEHVHGIDDVTDLSIVSYALILSKSDLSAFAYEKLRGKAFQANGHVYWSQSPIESNVVRNEFNRPFMEAKACQDQDAKAVQSTAYALLSSLIISGSGILTEQDRIILWLNTMKQSSGGFIAFVDTILALEALVQYSYNSRMQDVTSLKVHVEQPQSNVSEDIRISSANIHVTHEIDIPNVYGHVHLFAKGSGQAVAQINVEYGVDFEPFTDKSPKDYFHLTIKESYFGRNKSEIAIESCFRWLLTNESTRSGPAMLVVDIPSGYLMNQPAANLLVKKSSVPEMVDADVTKTGKTIWYFSHVPSALRCFTHSVRRYFPVSNHTRTRQAIIIERENPERFFIRAFNSTSLHVLSICEVCGSYQCPYCPTFSGGEMYSIQKWLLLLLLIYYAHRIMDH